MNLFGAIFKSERDNRIGIAYENREISYAELRAQSLNINKLLECLQANPGDRIAILLNDSPEFVASFIACCSSAVIAVPINTALTLSEQLAILQDCSARFLIVEFEMCGRLLKDVQNRLPNLAHVVVVDRGDNQDQDSIDCLNQRQVKISLYSELTSEVGAQTFGEGTPTSETAPAFILYTSGSTGEPKGAVHCQKDILYTNETYCQEVLRLREGDWLFSSSRLPFAYGLGNSLTFPLLNGHTSVLCREKPTPPVIADIFRRYNPTVFFGVPVIFNLLLDHHHRIETVDSGSLRLCISAGEALPTRLGEEWEKTFGVRVLDGIGSTEMLHMWMSNHEDEVRYGSSGKVLQGYEARLLDEQGESVHTGASGNLWVRGASAASCYWQRPEATSQTFIAGWVRTGDLYTCDQDGYWWHKGRSDDCFKSSGQWVSPLEVEALLLQHASVSRAVVVEDFDDDGLPCPAAFLVCQDSELELGALENELRELSREGLPRFKRPRRYLFVQELPYTATGKIQRFRLRQELRSGELATHAPRAASLETTQ